MLKNITVLEINGKKEILGNVEIKTPSELMFANRTEQIVNCHIFDDFIDDMFMMTTDEIVNEVHKKIDNVYITFVDDTDALVCSIVLDKLKPKRGRYRMKIVDWQSRGYILKFAEDVEDNEADNYYDDGKMT